MSYAAVRGCWGASALDEVLFSGGGVDLGRVLAGSASFAGPGTATRGAWPHGPPVASASGWAAPSVAAHRLGGRGLIKASGRYGGRNFGERPGARLSAETAFFMLPMPWTTSPTCSAAFGSCDPLCAQCAPEANAAWPRTECPLASVEGRWSPLASVVVRQSDDIVT